MNSEERFHFLSTIELFADLPRDMLRSIAADAYDQTLSENELLIQEKSVSDCFYVITKGLFSVYRNNENDNASALDIALLKSGDTVGELAFIDQQARSANVKALEDNSTVIVIESGLLKQAPSSFYLRLSKKLSNSIRNGNEAIMKELRNEIEQSQQIANMGKLITYVLLLLSFYNLAINGFVYLVNNRYTSMFASTSIIMVFTVALTVMVFHMKYPLTNCGVNLHHWRTSLKESLLYTALFLVGMTLLKLLIIQLVPQFQGQKLIDFERVVTIAPIGTSTFYLWLFLGMTIYAIFVNFQEFISRGILQTLLQNFLQHKRKKLIANVVTSGVFASTHIHLSPTIALFVFFPSLFWGWLYMRNQTLIGPIISHILIGLWAIFGLGMQDLFR